MNPMTGFRGLKVLVIDDDHAFFEIAYNGNTGYKSFGEKPEKEVAFFAAPLSWIVR